MAYFLTVAEQVLILFVLIAVGFVCGKTGLLQEKAILSMTNLVLYLATPCVIFQSFLRPYDPAMLRNLLCVLAASVAVHLIAILLARLCLRKGADDRRLVAQFAVVFSNAGYMCLPLQQALYGDVGVFYGSVYIAAFNVVLWSYGFLSMRRDAGAKLPVRQLLLNPGLIGVTAGLVAFLTSLRLPAAVTAPIGHLAVLNTPVPMLIIGFYLSQSNLAEALRSRSVYLPVVLRLIVVPAVTLLGLWACGLRDVPLFVCVIAAGAPAAAATTMFSAKFGRDTLFSVQLVSISTLLSIFTMPTFVLLTRWLAG